LGARSGEKSDRLMGVASMPAARGEAVSRMEPHGLMLHHFFDATHPRGQGAIDADCFRRLLRAIGLQRFLPAKIFQERALSGALKDGDLCISFDDALRCQYDVALPVLRELGLTAFWFVYSGVFQGHREPLEVFRYFRTVAFPDVEAFYAAFDAAVRSSAHAELVRKESAGIDFRGYLSEVTVYTDSDRRFRYLRDRVLGPERYNEVMWHMIREAGYENSIPPLLLWMDDACLKELAQEGHVIGLHSYSHPTLLEALPALQQRAEYERNAAHLSAVTGQKPVTVSHPCNSYSGATLSILDDMGVQLGFRANMAKRDYSLLELPRIDHAVLVRELGL
jgi:peptidoglycan/xylan/chitin deacetylase (PgdA/CDA1 family)